MFKKAAIALSAVLMGCALFGGTISAFAGASDSNVVTEASVQNGKINSGDFFTDGDVSAEGSDILFGERGNAANANVLAKTKINDLGQYGVSEIFSATMQVTLSDMAEGGSFSVCFGLKSLSADCGSEQSVELKFYEDGGVWFAVNEYVAEGIYGVLSEPRQYSDAQEGDTVTLEFSVSTNNALTLSLNDTSVLAGEKLKLVEDASGYFGMFSDGLNKVRVGGMKVTAFTYEAPENFNYTESFDNNEYNANVFYSESKSSPLSPSGLVVEDGKLYFCNTAASFFTTRYRYSNFALEFEISDLRNAPQYDENGNLVGLISGWFGIAFGVGDLKQIADYTVQTETWLQFEGVPIGVDHTVPYEGARFVMMDNGQYLKTQGMGFNLWNEEFMQGRAAQVRFTVVDGVVTLYMKFAGEQDWGQPQFEYDLGYTPSGYIRIFTYGETSVTDLGLAYNSAANFKIDNFALENKDYEGVRNLIDEPPFKTNVIEATPDYEYTDRTDPEDLLSNRLENGEAEMVASGCSSAIPAVSVAGAAGLMTVSALCVRRKKR